MTDLSDITLIVPSYKRQHFALRALQYWSGKGPQVYVIDGSDHGLEQSELDDLSDNVHYLHIAKSQPERIKLSIDLIKTKYAMLACDDEFYVPDALKACLRELDSDPELVACMGRALAFKVQDRRLVGYPFYLDMDNYSVMEGDPGKRIFKHMSSYKSSISYSVMRAEVWKRASTLTTDINYNLYELGELQFEVMVNYLGKSKVIPHLMWLRGFEVEPVRGTNISVLHSNSFMNWWKDSDRINEHTNFLLHMTQHLEVGSDTNSDTIYRDLEAAFGAYVKCIDSRNVKSSRPTYSKIRGRLIRTVAEYMPSVLKDVLRPYLVKPERLPSLREAALELEQSGCSVNAEELEDIISVVECFHGIRPNGDDLDQRENANNINT